MASLDSDSDTDSDDAYSLQLVSALESTARARLPVAVFDYYAGGAGDEITLRDNERAWRRWRIRTRTLVQPRLADTRWTCRLGAATVSLASPVAVAPVALQRMAHAEGELATARACQSADALFVLSTTASASIEDVRRAAPTATIWLQLYLYDDLTAAALLVKRAVSAGFGAVVLTVDAPVLGLKERDLRNRFTMPAHVTLANFVGDSKLTQGRTRPMGVSGKARFSEQARFTWQQLEWLQSVSALPVILKGVLTADDAVAALEHGCAGVIVSNHGGRQLDGAIATFDALEGIARAVRSAVGSRGFLLGVDGGVRHGSSVFKALAMGADFVLVGRPVIWALAAEGQRGVERVLDSLTDQLRQTMTACCCDSLAAISLAHVQHEEELRSRL